MEMGIIEKSMHNQNDKEWSDGSIALFSAILILVIAINKFLTI